MLYLPTESIDPNFYFALEEYLMSQIDRYQQNIFMIWQTDLTVMLGNFQNVYSELNLPALEKDKVKITRRNTGGGTIFTDRGGWQYSFICPRRQGEQAHEDIDFQRFMQDIIVALNKLDIPAEKNSRNDLAIKGKKISGNAQCFKGNATLHHGSLLFNSDLEAMVAYLCPAKHKLITKGIKSIRERTCNIKDYCPQDWTAVDFKEALVKVILGAEVETLSLSQEDLAAVQEIKKDKFETWEWVYGRNPQFSLVKEKVWPGGLLKIHCQINQGNVESLIFEGDFFTAHDLHQVEEALVGQKFEKKAIEDFFQRHYPQDLIHHISNQDIIETLFLDL